MESSKEHSKLTSGKTFAWMLAIVLSLWVGIGYFASTREDAGKFGDMFGAVNALFAGLAFAGLIYTILLQREELGLQREELKQTRNELSGQKEQMQQQNSTLTLQRFENTFFELLRLHNDVLNSIDLMSSDGKRTVGRDCFSAFVKRLQYFLRETKPAEGHHTLNSIESAFKSFYEDNEGDIAHYFRLLFNIFKFLDTSALDDAQKKFYANLIRAQLSSQELFVLYFDGLSSYGYGKMKPLIEKYGLLKHVNRKLLIATGAFSPLYSANALP